MRNDIVVEYLFHLSQKNIGDANDDYDSMEREYIQKFYAFVWQTSTFDWRRENTHVFSIRLRWATAAFAFLRHTFDILPTERKEKNVI